MVSTRLHLLPSAGIGGVVVADVVPGSGAEAAGITAGSTITRIDGRAVTSADALRSVIAESKPGEKHVYVRNPKYKPRTEPASGLAGGKVAKAVLTAISNTRRGSGDQRHEDATAIQWTLWGAQAEKIGLTVVGPEAPLAAGLLGPPLGGEDVVGSGHDLFQLFHTPGPTARMSATVRMIRSFSRSWRSATMSGLRPIN